MITSPGRTLKSTRSPAASICCCQGRFARSFPGSTANERMPLDVTMLRRRKLQECQERRITLVSRRSGVSFLQLFSSLSPCLSFVCMHTHIQANRHFSNIDGHRVNDVHPHLYRETLHGILSAGIFPSCCRWWKFCTLLWPSMRM